MTEFEKLFEEKREYIFKYLMTLSKDYSLAEELTQETFYRATKKISEFRGEAKMSTWLCQIAKFVYYQSLDKKRRRKEVSFDEAVELAMQEDTQKSIEDAEAKMNIFKEIYKLSSPMRDVVMLRLTGELSFKEIGDIMAQSENWARVTFYRAKHILGKELKRDE